MALPALVRQGLGALGGVLLALLLFTLLALLVAPPENEPVEIEMPVSVAMIEAIEKQAPTPASQVAESTPAPVDPPPPPPPALLPSPTLKSDIALPEPEIETMERPEMPQELVLPELVEIDPEPPQPQPEPAPTTQPVRTPSPQPSPQPLSSEAVADASGETEAQDSPATEPGEVGSPQPTRRVPPEYPMRAQRRGLEGYVEVRFTIQSDGSVDRDSLRVVEARPRNVFERAAIKAISRWQFPAASGPREARQRLEFKLEG